MKSFALIFVIFLGVTFGSFGLARAEGSKTDVKLVTGTTPCSGNDEEGELGTFVSVSVTACAEVPCELHAKSSYEIALTLKLSVTTGNLYLTLAPSLFGNNRSEVTTVFMPGTYEAGRQYRVAHTLVVPEIWRGRGARVTDKPIKGTMAVLAHLGAAPALPGQVCRHIPFSLYAKVDEALSSSFILNRADEVPHTKAISGTRPCESVGGGNATFVGISVLGCEAVPCILYAGSSYEFAVTFRATTTTRRLYLTLREHVHGSLPNDALKAYLPGTYTAGFQYRVAHEFIVPAAWRGDVGLFTAVVHVGEVTKLPGEVCRDVDVEIAGARQRQQLHG